MKCAYLFSARVNALFFFVSFVLSSSSLFSLLADGYILCVYLSFIRTMRMVFCVREGSGETSREHAHPTIICCYIVIVVVVVLCDYYVLNYSRILY